jgi:hypothetical protein
MVGRAAGFPMLFAERWWETAGGDGGQGAPARGADASALAGAMLLAGLLPCDRRRVDDPVLAAAGVGRSWCWA